MLARPQDALPTTLAADESSGGLGVKMTFEVWSCGLMVIARLKA
jgi:hypothetical protein